MENLHKIVKNKFLLLSLILLIAAFLRLWQLGSVPVGIPDDEAAYIYNAYSIWHTGKDILGNFMPLSFNAHSSMSPVPVYFTAPFVGLMGLSAFSGRLAAALASIGSVLLLFLVTANLFKDRKIALFSAFLLAISPWALQLGRGAIPDATFALFFFLFGIYIFIANVNTRRYLWSLIPLALGFYSYHATKVFFIFLIPVLLIFYRKELLKRKKEAGLFLLGILLILVSFVIVMKTQAVTRQANVSLLNDSTVSTQVNFERQKNEAPQILRVIFSNKALTLLKTARENYLKAFSTEYLFLSGESGNFSQIVNIYFRGELYIIEFPLLLLGLYFLFNSKDKFSRNLIIVLLLIGPLPSTFTFDRNFIDRDIMMLPILLIVAACGINQLVNALGKYKKIYKYTFFAIFAFFYLFLISSYLYQYYFRWTVYGAEGWNRSSRDLLYSINAKKTQFKNVYIGKADQNLLMQYAIYNQVDPNIIQKVWQEDPIKLKGVTIFPYCLNQGEGYTTSFLPKSTLYVAAFGCNYKNGPSSQIRDYGEPLRVIWNIYENN